MYEVAEASREQAPFSGTTDPRDAQALLRIAASMGRLGAWVVELDGMRLVWSDEVRAIHQVPPGFTCTVAEAIGFYAPWARPIMAEAFRRCVQEGRPFDVELQLITARDEWIWVRAIGEAEHDDGRIVRVRGAFQDITRAKQAAEQSRELAERLTMTLESLPDGFFTLDRDWQFTYVNPPAERLLDRPRAEMLSRSIWELFPEAVGSTFQREYERALRTSAPVEFEEHYSPLGIWVQVRAFPSPQGLAVSFRDVTAQVQAQQELVRSRALLSTAMVTAGLATVQIDRDTGEVVAANRLRQVLCSRREPATFQDILDAVDPGSRSALRKYLRQDASQRRRSSSLLQLQVQRGSQPRWLRVRLAAQPDEGAATTTLVFQDVTTAVRARQSILRLNANLGERVRERTRELEAANRELAAFSYSVSHDLKAPLVALDGFSHLLAPRLRDDDVTATRYLQNIRSGVANMFSLIEAMLSLTHLTGSSRADLRQADLAPIVRSIVQELQAAAPSNGIAVEVQDEMVVQCDPALLTIALRNLLGNAWKYCGGKSAASIRVTAEVERSGEWATIRVEDSGAGFEPSQAHRLFTPFQRLHRQDEFPGTGIGLATVQRVVNRHGGVVSAEGRPGLGATFTMRLPQRTRCDATAESAGGGEAGCWFD